MIGPTQEVGNLLLSELRHRLSNSFQLLQAVIHIRLRSADDPESRRHLSWLLDVVTALAMLQQRIGVVGSSDFGAYLVEAASYWRRICEGRPIGIVVNVDSVQVSESQASTLALIAHELITNSIEHAFPHGRAGSVELKFSERRDGMRELTVRDDGAGLAEGPAGPARQGLELVRGLAAHLGGAVEMVAENGVCVRVSVPREEGPRPH
ncbi:MAG TPA: sensor histidine kinase [Caulobacteraceae bacterium]|jgi:two-component sensor histidine kinase|nr:sensor histidine kinase [Caulobacteraceae bacterium]